MSLIVLSSPESKGVAITGGWKKVNKQGGWKNCISSVVSCGQLFDLLPT